MRTWIRRLWPAACAVVLFAAYFELSTRAAIVNSDGASQALQAWDMLHGNLLLRGWALSDVSFYTTELPQYMLVEAVRGLDPGVVHVAAAMSYTLLILLAAALAAGRARGREGVCRAVIAAGILLAPEPGNPVNVLLLSPDHVGTGVPVLLTWMIADRGAGWRPRTRWLAPAGIGVLLAWTTVGDPLAALIGAAPLAITCGLRVLRAVAPGPPERRQEAGRACRYELSVAVAAAVSVPVARTAVALIGAAGGWTASPVGAVVAPPAMLPHNLLLTLRGVLQLLGADVPGQPAEQVTFALVHLAGVALVVWALWLAVRRFLAAELLVQGLTVAIGLNLAAYAGTTLPQNITTTREIAAVLPFGAVLAGRLLARRLLSWHPALAGLLAAYAVILAVNIAGPPLPAASADLSRWLAAHRLTCGLAGYWQANVITLDSRDTVQVRAVMLKGPRVAAQPYWNARQGWYDGAAHYADFVVSASVTDWHQQRIITRLIAEAGRPAGIYTEGPFTVAVWHRNLLTRLR